MTDLHPAWSCESYAFPLRPQTPKFGQLRKYSQTQYYEAAHDPITVSEAYDIFMED